MNIDPDLQTVLNASGTVFLDATEQGKAGKKFLFSNPVSVVQARQIDEVECALQKLDEKLKAGFYVAGYISYEAAYAFQGQRFSDQRHQDWYTKLGYPLVWFGVYKERQEGFHSEISDDLKGNVRLSEFRDASKQGAYQDAVRTIRDLIAEGDVYQINHTTRFLGEFDGDVAALYFYLRNRQHVDFGSFLNVGDRQFLSYSPELFFKRQGTAISTRPMKGTAPRGQSAGEDEALAHWLSLDVKSRAENLMIVDLLRNDLSIICETGSVHVPHLFDVESLPTVHQMTSTIEGKLLPNTPLSSIIGALFPCGSITGAPKIRAMRRINELESTPRGIYCGAIGYAGPGTDGGEIEGSFSVAIRTLSVHGNQLTYGAGGGIVWDSDPDAEYEEAVLKTSFLGDSKSSYELIETMRYSSVEGVRLLDFHLDRLEQSSSVMAFAMQRDEIGQAIHSYCAQLDSEVVHRVRLTLSPKGQINLTSKPFEAPESPLKIGLSGIRVASGNPRLGHKTTLRGIYDRARAVARAHGWFDALLINERDEVTEGAVSNLFLRLDGGWVTPPLSSGVLPGVGRRDFFLNVGATERPIYKRDLKRAKEICLTNAIMGTQSAVWSGE